MCYINSISEVQNDQKIHYDSGSVYWYIFNACNCCKCRDIIAQREYQTKHYTWTNTQNIGGPSHVKEKIEYQKKYYDNGECGYEWDEYNQRILKK